MFIKRFALPLAALVLGALCVTSVQAQDATNGYLMTETEKNAIRDIVEEYINDNPEVILKSIEKKARAQAEKQYGTQDRVAELPDGIYDSPFAPSVGRDNADITIVEFFDYNCGYCKRVIGDVNRLISEDATVKVSFRELPILSEDSEIAARYALAANKQGRYLDFHTKLMEHSGRINQAVVEKYGVELGLDAEKLKKDADSQDIRDAIAENKKLARDLGVRGTPFFLIGNQKVPGAVGYTRLQSIIAEERAKLKSKDSAAGESNS